MKASDIKKMNIDGELVLTVSEDRLEKDEDIRIEYVAEIMYAIRDGENTSEEKLEKDFLFALEKVFGKKGEKKYIPRIVEFPSLSKETEIADNMNLMQGNAGDTEILSVFFLKYSICEEDRKKIENALKPRPEECLFG